LASRPTPTRGVWKSLRLQNADLLTQYNLYEADLARPKVKEADFRGKASIWNTARATTSRRCCARW
jgi:glycine cleavage system aminomethyltransferase T